MDQDAEYAASLEKTKEALEFYRAYLLNNMDGCLSVDFEESPKYADFDYYVYINGNFHHYLEVKTRRNEFGKYIHTKIPIRKHTFAEHTYLSEGKKTVFLCVFECGTMAVLHLHVEPDKTEVMVARWDRGDHTDLYALYNLSRFTIIRRPLELLPDLASNDINTH